MRKILTALALGAALVTTAPAADAVGGASVAGVAAFGVADAGESFTIENVDVVKNHTYTINTDDAHADAGGSATFEPEQTVDWPTGAAEVFIDGNFAGFVIVTP